MQRTILLAGLLAGVVPVLGCGGLFASDAPAPSPAATEVAHEMHGLRVHVADDIAIVVEGDNEPRLGEQLKTAVEVELGRAGIVVVPTSKEASDLVLRIETHVTGAVYFLRGHVGLTAERAGVAVAQVSTEDEFHRDGEFTSVMARKAVAALLRAPSLAQFSGKKAPRQDVAVARPAHPPAPAKMSPAAEAKARYARGTSYYNLNRFHEALAEYEAAYMAVQDPPFLFNIAQCYRKMGDDKQAVDFYRSYLRVAPNAPNRGEVQKRIVELEREERASR